MYLSDIIAGADNAGAIPPGQTITIDIPEVDLRRWRLLYEAEKRSELLEDGQYLLDRIRNFPRFAGIREDFALYVGLAVTGFVYGGLHCLAWNAPFATRPETLLWRISSAAIMSTPVLVLLGYSWTRSPPLLFGSNYSYGFLDLFSDHIYDPLKKFVGRLLDPRWVEPASIIISLPLFILTVILPRVIVDLTVASAFVLYCLARVYLVVECFINLSHLPTSVYQIPGWSQYVPHIS